MEVVILAGGLGTRLASVLPQLPKALAPIQQAPFLKILLEQLHKWGKISRVILALGHKATLIQDYVKTLNYPFSISFSLESSPLGTGGALYHALSQVRQETFLVMNGDSYFDLSFDAFLQFHLQKRASISIACLQIEDTSRYGSVVLNDEQRVTAFLEKSANLKHGQINGGLYLIQKSALKAPPIGASSLEKEIFPSLLAEGIYAFCHQGTFIDIGTPSSLAEAQTILQK